MNTHELVLIACLFVSPALAAAQVTPPPARPPVGAPLPHGAPRTHPTPPAIHVPPPYGAPVPMTPPATPVPPGAPYFAHAAPPAQAPPHPVPVPDQYAYGLAPRARDFIQAPQWYQGDPADSLFRAAYGFFSRQEYRPATTRFSELRSKHPTSRYYCDAAYYEAFARYRLGTPNDLRTGYQVLEGMTNRCTQRSRREDVPELTVRINSALARQGDAEAADRIRRAANEGQNVCDSEERNVKIEALTALAQMDPQNANPVLRSVLSAKDPCSAPIRRQAIMLVARRNDPESVSLLGQIARNDADRENQLEAVRALGRMSSDAAFAALEEFIRNSNDERVQTEAASAMARSEHARAQAAIRVLIERTDVAERIRAAAINSLAARPNIPVEYWQSLYSKMESDELRMAVMQALARTNTDAAQQFLLTVARNQAEPYEVRAAAIQRIRATAPVGELYRLLQTADSRSIRLSIVSGLSARKEPEATDRLIDIAMSSTDTEVSRAAIRALSQPSRNQDPKVIRALSQIMVR
ncbi:MAG: HEAT repeat domain-containing protein [Longimicrobiales bacterium]